MRSCDPTEVQELVPYTTELFLYLCGKEPPLTIAYLWFCHMSNLKLNLCEYQP